jgi:hypothetical protein
MDITIDNLIQALPLAGSAITSLIVFVKRGIIKDVDITELKGEVKEIDKSVSTMKIDMAVLKEKIRSLSHDIKEEN